ncbi:MAG: hypothetical protein AAGA86_14070 [Bacteroidota bacterium]
MLRLTSASLSTGRSGQAARQPGKPFLIRSHGAFDSAQAPTYHTFINAHITHPSKRHLPPKAQRAHLAGEAG